MAPTVTVCDPDNRDQPTADPVAIHTVFAKAWAPVNQRYDQSGPETEAKPSREIFQATNARHIPRIKADFSPLTGEDLYQQAQRTKPSATALDGWALAELPFLPVEIWEYRANVIQSNANLPQRPMPSTTSPLP